MCSMEMVGCWCLSVSCAVAGKSIVYQQAEA